MKDGNDRLFGGDDNDVLVGNAGNDRLNGERGDDQLFGNDGLDALFGGEGSDVGNGGNDLDTFNLGGQTGDLAELEGLFSDFEFSLDNTTIVAAFNGQSETFSGAEKVRFEDGSERTAAELVQEREEEDENETPNESELHAAQLASLELLNELRRRDGIAATCSRTRPQRLCNRLVATHVGQRHF